MRTNDKERCRSLMMSAIDGEIAPSEKEELSKLLKKYPDLNREFSTFHHLKEVMNKVELKKAKDDLWTTYWFNIYHRLERGLAWFLFAMGAALLVAYGLFQAVLDIWVAADLPMIIKIGIYSTILGVLVLLISVIREKLFLKRNERYREVRR